MGCSAGFPVLRYGQVQASYDTAVSDSRRSLALDGLLYTALSGIVVRFALGECLPLQQFTEDTFRTGQCS